MGNNLIFLSINLVKLYTHQISGLTTIKSLFSKETETTKVTNLFDYHHIIVHDATMHSNNIFIFFSFFPQNLCVPYEYTEFSVNALYFEAYNLQCRFKNSNHILNLN